MAHWRTTSRVALRLLPSGAPEAGAQHMLLRRDRDPLFSTQAPPCVVALLPLKIPLQKRPDLLYVFSIAPHTLLSLDSFFFFGIQKDFLFCLLI
jgi:hypothetical protein